MKIFLTVACGLAILLTGGCAIAVGSEMASLAIPLFGIAALNALMLAALLGASRAKWPFYVLGVADIVLALIAASFAIAFAADRYMQGAVPVVIGLAVFILAKGYFSFKYANSL